MFLGQISPIISETVKDRRILWIIKWKSWVFTPPCVLLAVMFFDRNNSDLNPGRYLSNFNKENSTVSKHWKNMLLNWLWEANFWQDIFIVCFVYRTCQGLSYRLELHTLVYTYVPWMISQPSTSGVNSNNNNNKLNLVSPVPWGSLGDKIPPSVSVTGYSLFRLQKCHDLENQVKVREGHWKCHHSMKILWLPIDVL